MTVLKLKPLVESSINQLHYQSMTDAELLNQLITLDYQGKEVKKRCVEELMKRAEDRGYKNGYETCRKAAHEKSPT